MAAQHGGFRKGAGRPKGSRNRATIAREARQREALATARAENANLSAIDYLLQVLRDRRLHQGVVLRGATRTFDISLISGRVFSTEAPSAITGV